MEIREAKWSDTRHIYRLIEAGVQEGALVERGKHDIRRNIKDFVVSVEDGIVTGCASFTAYSRRIGEIRSVYVHPNYRGHGTAYNLIKHATEKSRDKSEVVFAVTESTRLFSKVGYKPLQVDGMDKGMVYRRSPMVLRRN